MSAAYYNEIDPFAAEWLRRLILFGHIAPGDVDERDIRDVSPDDLRGYEQHHFFAGIGVWSYAARRAGWADDRRLASGSCPCQPFSAAGSRGGFADERHLWPSFHHLIRECGFPVVVGEQVASKDGLAWLDLVSADMEGSGYAGGAVDLCAAGFGAPHIRQRLYFAWLADAARQRHEGRAEWPQSHGGADLSSSAKLTAWPTPAASDGSGGRMPADATLTGWSTPTCPVNTNGHQAGNNRYVTSVTSVTKTLDHAIRGRLTASGEMEIGCCVEALTESQSGAPLRPGHSRWLMGLPEEWDFCGGMGTRSTRKRPKASSKR